MPSTGLRGVYERGDFGSDEPVLCEESDDSDDVDVPADRFAIGTLSAARPRCEMMDGDFFPF